MALPFSAVVVFNARCWLMKTATHGADEGRSDLRKSVLTFSRRQKFCEFAAARTGRTGELVLFPVQVSFVFSGIEAPQRSLSETLRVVSESFFSLLLDRLRSGGETISADTHGICVRQIRKVLQVRAARTAPDGLGELSMALKWRTKPKVKTAACTCLISFQNNVPLSTNSVSFCNKQCQRLSERVMPSIHVPLIKDQSGRSVADSSRAESSARSETLRVGSESFFSLSLEHQRSAGEMARRCRYAPPSVLDRHQKFCKSAARLDGYVEFKWRSNGERATDRARIKAPWTHEGP